MPVEPEPRGSGLNRNVGKPLLLWWLLRRLPRQSGYAVDADGALGSSKKRTPMPRHGRENVPQLPGPYQAELSRGL
jgi:hypothetical protein